MVSSPGDPALSGLLALQMRALRRRQAAVAVLSGAALLAVIAVELLGLAMFLDWWLDLPWGVRLVSVAAQFAIFSFLLLRFVVGPLVRQPDDDTLALLVERARPEFRSRLIAALQLTRPGAVPPDSSRSLVNALVEETERLARPMSFPSIIPTERLRALGILAAIVMLLGVTGMVQGGATGADLLRRAFLSNVPVPRKTRLFVAEGDRRVGRGDTVRLSVQVEGIVPSRARVEVKSRSRRTRTFDLERDPENPFQFNRSLENVQDDFTCQFFAGDAASASYTITTAARPAVATLESDQVFPAYTGLKPVGRTPGDLTLLAGSVLNVRVTATKDIRAASLRLVGADTNVAMTVNPASPRELRGQFQVPARSFTGFQVQMIDREDMESRDSAIYRVDVLPDRAPTARLTFPERKEELVTRYATMLIGFEASDDFAVARTRLLYKVDSLDGGAEKVTELALPETTAPRVRHRFEWRIPDAVPGVTEGSVIEFWLEALDANHVTGPGVGRTEHHVARVVSEAEKRADLLNRAADYFGSISDVLLDQEKLNRALGQLIELRASQ